LAERAIGRGSGIQLKEGPSATTHRHGRFYTQGGRGVFIARNTSGRDKRRDASGSLWRAVFDKEERKNAFTLSGSRKGKLYHRWTEKTPSAHCVGYGGGRRFRGNAMPLIFHTKRKIFCGRSRNGQKQLIVRKNLIGKRCDNSGGRGKNRKEVGSGGRISSASGVLVFPHFKIGKTWRGYGKRMKKWGQKKTFEPGNSKPTGRRGV